MTKSAREVIEEFLRENEDTIVADCDAVSLIVALRDAGYVILPKEPSEEMIEAGLKATMAVIFDHPKESDTLSVIRNLATAASYRAMISTVGEER